MMWEHEPGDVGARAGMTHPRHSGISLVVRVFIRHSSLPLFVAPAIRRSRHSSLPPFVAPAIRSSRCSFSPLFVTPAKAGGQYAGNLLGSRFRGNDEAGRGNDEVGGRE